MTEKRPRIIGYDFARGLAIIGMVIVNFKVVMSAESDSPLYQALDLLSGKAAALFVILAGIGMTLMYQSAQRKNDRAKIRKVKVDLLKRALFLFVVGLSYYFIWPADILHYYGVYMLIGVLLLGAPTRLLQGISVALLLVYVGMLMAFDYKADWNWELYTYPGFFTPEGFTRNLFFNGFHPVIPWVAFMLTGIWIGRIDLSDKNTQKRVAVRSLLLFIGTTVLSKGLITLLTSDLPAPQAENLQMFLSTEPMPPSPFYMVSAASLAVFIITVSVRIGFTFSHTLFVKQLVSAGQLALSNYIFHVVIGMLAVAIIFDKLDKAFSVEFAFFYAMLFNVLLVIFSHLWRRKYDRGPLEWLMRRITG